MVLPAELKDLERWILWRFETRDEKRTKVPYSANGRRASTTNPATWSSFDAACAATGRVPANGIGFVFSGDDNIIGVDLDHVRDPTSGAIKPWARGVIDTLQSYTELSPSGTGFHVVLRGTKPPGSQCNLRFDPVTREGFEIYSTARYFTITGKHVAGTPVEVRSVSDAVIARVLAEMEAKLPKKPTAPTVSPRGDAPITVDNAELLSRMFNSRSGAEIACLYHGHADHASASDADIALCGRLAFLTGKDSAQMDRLFRGSALMRQKWDTRRGESTYGAMTIAKAIANCRETYSATPSNRTASGDQRRAESPGTIQGLRR
jgi:putative DNA primase/helicase